MSDSKVPITPRSEAGPTATGQVAGTLSGMTVTVATGAPKKAARPQATESFWGIKRLFKSLRQRMGLANEPAGSHASGRRARGQELPRLPDGSVNVEALFNHSELLDRLKMLADEYGRTTSQAVRFLEMAQQLPPLESNSAARAFVDAVRSEFTSDTSDPWNHTEGSTADLDARLRTIKEKASCPEANPEVIKAEIHSLVGHMRATQLKLVATDLLPALQAEFR